LKRLIDKIDTTLAFQIFQISRFGTWLVISFFLVKFLPEQSIIGEFEYSLFLLSLVSFFWNIGLKNALVNYYSKSLQQEISLSIVFYLLFFAGLCTAIGIGLYASYSDVDYIHDNRFILIFLFLFFGLSTLPEYILLLRKRSLHLVVYGIVIHGLLLFVMVTALLTKPKLELLLMVYTFWMLIKVVYTVWLLKGTGYQSITQKGIFDFIGYSLPFMFYIVMNKGMEFVDGLIVRQFFPLDVFPVYRYGAKEFPISLILFSALATASIPLYIKSGRKSLIVLRNKVKVLIFILFPIIAVLLIISPFLFKAVYNELYLDSAKIFNIHLLIIFSRVWLPQVVLVAKEYMKQLIFFSGIEIIINISLSIVFIQSYGLLGIAYGTLIAYLIHKSLLVLYLNIKEGIIPSEYMPIPIYTVFSVILFAIFVISQNFLF
jgi:O-antigen/teichoic acid export membrane protein